MEVTKIDGPEAPIPVTAITDPNKPRVYRLGDLLDEWNADIETRHEARLTGKPMGITTGLSAVDRAIGGFLQPGLHSLQGGTGIGKTAFALQVATNCAFPALYVSCEMKPLELLRRITARVTGTYLGKFKSGELEPDRAAALVTLAIEAAPELAILDSTRGYVPTFANDSNPDAMNIHDLAKTLRGDAPHVLIVIDSLHSWAANACPGTTEYEYLNSGINSLTSLAAALNCPVLCIAERNRASKDSGGVAGGAGSRKIEYSGESVMEIDKSGDEDANGEKPITFKLSKNRNGTTGRPVELRFHGAIQRFREV